MIQIRHRRMAFGSRYSVLKENRQMGLFDWLRGKKKTHSGRHETPSRSNPAGGGGELSQIICSGCGASPELLYENPYVNVPGFGRCEQCSKLWCNRCANSGGFLVKCPRCNEALKSFSMDDLEAGTL
jgi:phage FluMu protein Com